MPNYITNAEYSVHPFASYSSKNINKLTRMISENKACLLGGSDSLRINLTSDTTFDIKPGKALIDDLLFDMTSSLSVDITDINNYYLNSGYANDGLFIVTIYFKWVKSMSYPKACVQIFDNTQSNQFGQDINYPPEKEKYLVIGILSVTSYPVINDTLDYHFFNHDIRRYYAPKYIELIDTLPSTDSTEYGKILLKKNASGKVDININIDGTYTPMDIAHLIPPTEDVDLNGQKLINLNQTPISDGDALAFKFYRDDNLASLSSDSTARDNLGLGSMALEDSTSYQNIYNDFSVTCDLTSGTYDFNHYLQQYKTYRFLGTSKLHINLYDLTYTFTTPQIIDHIDADKFDIKGLDPIPVTISQITSNTSGVEGNYLIDIILNEDTTNINVGNYIFITQAPTEDNPELNFSTNQFQSLCGCWKITAKNDLAKTLTINWLGYKNRGNEVVVFPNGSPTNMSGNIIKSVIKTPGNTGLIIKKKLGSLLNVVLEGDNTPTTRGITCFDEETKGSIDDTLQKTGEILWLNNVAILNYDVGLEISKINSEREFEPFNISCTNCTTASLRFDEATFYYLISSYNDNGMYVKNGKVKVGYLISIANYNNSVELFDGTYLECKSFICSNNEYIGIHLYNGSKMLCTDNNYSGFSINNDDDGILVENHSEIITKGPTYFIKNYSNGLVIDKNSIGDLFYPTTSYNENTDPYTIPTQYLYFYMNGGNLLSGHSILVKNNSTLLSKYVIINYSNIAVLLENDSYADLERSVMFGNSHGIISRNSTINGDFIILKDTDYYNIYSEYSNIVMKNAVIDDVTQPNSGIYAYCSTINIKLGCVRNNNDININLRNSKLDCSFLTFETYPGGKDIQYSEGSYINAHNVIKTGSLALNPNVKNSLTGDGSFLYTNHN